MSKFWGIGLGLVSLFAAFLAVVFAYGAMHGGGEGAPVAKKTEVRPLTRDLDMSGIVPHKALYKIEMVQKRSSSQVVNISGDMYFELKPACDAWMTDHRFNLLYEYPESPQMRISSDFTTYERKDGDSFNFNSRRRRDGEMYEQMRGQALMTEEGGQAVFTIPQDLTFDLPAGTLFPMAHTITVLNAARAQKKFVVATIFDGSDAEGPTEVTAFIGKPVNASTRVTPSPQINADLLATAAWNVRMAFFPLNSDEAGSDYEMDVVLHDNGIISDMYIEYKDFSVTQKLVALEPLTGEDCSATAQP